MDLIFTSTENIKVSYSDTYVCPVDKYHPPLDILLNFSSVELFLEPNTSCKYNLINADYKILNNEIQNLNWEVLLNECNNIDDMVKNFYSKIRNILEMHVTKKHSKNYKNKYPVWYSYNLKKRLKEKNKYRILFKKYGNPLDEIEFKILRDTCQHLIDFDYKKYIKSVELNININPKYFYSYIKNLRGNKCDYPALMTLDDCHYTDGEDICNQFANYFSRQCVEYDNSLNNVSSFDSGINNNSSLSTINISENEILSKLKSLDIKKGPGPDNIPPIFIRRTASTLVKPLYIIYCKSIKDGKFPTYWKKTRIVAVFKNGDKKCIENYRPISILSVFAKIFESLICPYLTWHIKPVISDSQHGFIKNRSTSTNLISFVEDIALSLDSNKQVDCIYTDLTKAFDVVNHKLLLSKLYKYGVHGKVLRLLESYLQNRQMNVVLGGYESRTFFLHSGVPQGSRLGPILFYIFYNDVITCLHHCSFLMYADDLKIYKKIELVNDCNLLQQDLDRFAVWCSMNSIKLNNKKCQSISFSRKTSDINYNYKVNGYPIKKVTQVRDLGITVDAKLSFVPHIDDIVSKSLSTLGFIIRSTKPFKKSSTIMILFNSLIKSQLEYCSTVWNPYYETHKNRLERIQKKFLKMLSYRDHVSNDFRKYDDLLKHYNMLKLSHRRDIADLCFLHKLVSGNLDCPKILSELNVFAPRLNTRLCTQNFKTRFAKTNLGLNAPLNRTVNLCNKLAQKSKFDIFNDSLRSYKAQLKKYFIHLVKNP